MHRGQIGSRESKGMNVMQVIINRIRLNFVEMLTILMSMARRIDYKTLTTYMTGISQLRDIESLMVETSKCLKDILNYKMFAFALHDEETLDVWIDPRTYREALEKVIKNDFRTDDQIKINYMNPQKLGPKSVERINIEKLRSYKLGGSFYHGRMYIIPETKVPLYHEEIIDMIVNTVDASLYNYLNIKKLKHEAAIDPLTGCCNRREFNRQLEREIANARRHNHPLSIFMFDIDHFKLVNDTYGHHAGDEVLRAVAKHIRNEIRTGDNLARYGGEEFIALLPQTEKTMAIELADRLRKKIEDLSIYVDGEKINVTVSFGVAELEEHSGKDCLVKDADSMLYKAKANGRNAVMPGVIKLFQTEPPKSLKLFTNSNG
jgi:diguanylate cyclase (GGDEF)-like protein